MILQNQFKEKGLEYLRAQKENGHTYYYYICNSHRDDGEKRIRKDSFNNGATCKKCMVEHNAKKKLRDAESNFYNYVKSIAEYEIIGKYKNANTKIEIKHLKCDKTYSVTPGHFKNGSRCPYCAGKYKDTNSFISEVKSLVGNEYTVIGEYISASKKISIKHNLCGNTYDVTPNKFLVGRRCPHCADFKNSYLSIEIERCLISFGIKYKREKTFQECRNINVLPFDFAIYDEKNNLYCLIEADGSQHEKPSDRFGGEKGLKITQIRDDIKNNFCDTNSIKLIRISYKDISEVEKIISNHLCSLIKAKEDVDSRDICRGLTKENIYKIRSKYIEDKTLSSRDIAKEFNTSHQTILSILHYKVFPDILSSSKDAIALKIKNRKRGKSKIGEDDKNKIIALHNTGTYSMRSIAKMFNVNHNLISRIIKSELQIID